MGIPRMKINLLNGSLYNGQTNKDGIVGMVAQVNESAVNNVAFNLGEPIMVNSVKELENYGLNKTSAENLYLEVVDFYSHVEPNTPLFITTIPEITGKCFSLDDIFDASSSETWHSTLMDNLLSKATKEGLNINILTLVTNGMLEVDNNAVIDLSATNTLFVELVNRMQAFSYSWASNNYPFRVVLPAMVYNVLGVGQALIPDFSLGMRGDNNRVALWAGSRPDSTSRAAIGHFVGRLSSIPVHRHISRDKNNKLKEVLIEEPCVSNSGLISTFSDTDKDYINDRGYNQWVTHFEKKGYFFANDVTATVFDDNYRSLTNGRVIDKFHKITYVTLIEYLNDDFEDGQIKQIQQKIINEVNDSMGDSISEARCFIRRGQDVIGTGKLRIKIGCRPVGYLNIIEADLDFYK